LTAATTSSWGLAWTYDDFGNRLTQSATAGSPPTSSLTYDTTNYTNRIVTSGYTYDNNGNLTAFPGPQGNTSVSYDAFDRAATITVGSSSSTVNYDAFGRRIQKTFAGGLQRLYFYDSSGKLLAEYDNPAWGSSPSRTTQYFAGQRVGQWTDRVGSKRADSGSSSQYYPYGEEITSTNNDTFKFAQTYRDSDSGLDYAWKRFYSSATGRFLTADMADNGGQATLPQSWNRYSYVLGNPVKFIDPGGMHWCDPDEDECDPCSEDPTQIGCDPNQYPPGDGSGGPPPPPECDVEMFTRPITQFNSIPGGIHLGSHSYLELIDNGSVVATEEGYHNKFNGQLQGADTEVNPGGSKPSLTGKLSVALMPSITASGARD